MLQDHIHFSVLVSHFSSEIITALIMSLFCTLEHIYTGILRKVCFRMNVCVLPHIFILYSILFLYFTD